MAIVFGDWVLRRDSASDATIEAALGAAAHVALGSAWMGMILSHVRSILLEMSKRTARGKAQPTSLRVACDYAEILD